MCCFSVFVVSVILWYVFYTVKIFLMIVILTKVSVNTVTG